MIKLIKNGTIILIIGVIGLIAVIGSELYTHDVDQQPPKGYTAEEIAAMKIEPININTASVDELSALPGLSKKQAQRIVDYREQNGDFESIEDVMNIKGIGEKAYKEFAYYITAK
ncbi:helix-hairpin-helix domain-containing protein [uncultured Ruminococcus sp.]|uniref:ComEA family DNA-binding protein n=1 Tax=uncultured Ruminococcus sp. TaxID=165186 RepID=UPI00292D5FCF|nr:helix-hairpin-helix domain-containing protein [uncultured Ruminococcus sp.]